MSDPTQPRWDAFMGHVGLPSDAERVATLEDRISRALTALQAAPDTLGDEASKRQARDVATANRVAWGILSEGRVPESVRCKVSDGRVRDDA